MIARSYCDETLPKSRRQTVVIKENLYVKSYLSGSKIGINAFIWRAYARGAYRWNNTSVKEKVGLSAGGLYTGGGLIGKEI